jgi:hypothetical protein
MTILKTGALCVLLNAVALTAFSQDLSKRPPHSEPTLNEPNYKKPKLFADLPQQFRIDIKSLETLLDLPVGDGVNMPLTGNFRYQGIVVSKSDGQDPNVKSVVIRSKNRVGSTLTFARIRNTDGSYSYTGRILSLNHSDAFELQRENETYVLTKLHLYNIFSE